MGPTTLGTRTVESVRYLGSSSSFMWAVSVQSQDRGLSDRSWRSWSSVDTLHTSTLMKLGVKGGDGCNGEKVSVHLFCVADHPRHDSNRGSACDVSRVRGCIVGFTSGVVWGVLVFLPSPWGVLITSDESACQFTLCRLTLSPKSYKMKNTSFSRLIL